MNKKVIRPIQIIRAARGPWPPRGDLAPNTLAALLLLFAALVSSCATPVPATPTAIQTPTSTTPAHTPTPEQPTPTTHIAGSPSPLQPYVNEALGFSLSYPVHWLTSDTPKGVVFGTSEETIAGGEFTAGAGVAIEVEPLPNAEWEDLEALALSRATVFSSAEMQIGEPQSRALGDQTGALVTLEGTPGLFTTELKGFVLAAAREHHSYVLVALSTLEDWPTYEPDLEALVESFTFLPFELPQYAPDEWEPDDTLAEATDLEPGVGQTHDLHTLGDRDCFRFTATRGHIYTIETFNLGPDVDTRIFLYDGEGSLLTQDDDGRTFEEKWASRLVWTAEKTSTHYVMVHDVDDDDAGPGTSYDVRIWEEAHFVEDEYEPDGSPGLATRLEPGEPQPHNLHLAGDADWMRLEIKAGHTYVVETFDLGEDVDTVLRLLDEEGNELLVDDNGRDEEEPQASRIRWTARDDGWLYVVAHDASEEARGPGTQYWVRLQETTQ
jgi:hypothetical protein